MCLNTELFWSVFSRIPTEYVDIRSISPYSVRIQKNTDQKKTPYFDPFHAVLLLMEMLFYVTGSFQNILKLCLAIRLSH